MILMRRYRRRVTVATLLSVGLSLVIATSALAVTWGTSRNLTSSGAGLTFPDSIVSTTGTSAAAIYENRNGSVRGVFIRRTSDAGANWTGSVLLSSVLGGIGGEAPAAASAGTIVDLVWLEGSDCIHGGCIVRYRRSMDGGLSWTPPRTLSRTADPPDSPGLPRVARRGSIVVVTWTSLNSGIVRVRTSLDGGLSWAGAGLGRTSSRPYAPAPLREAFPVPAIGSGVIYVAYYGSFGALQVRRSTDNGTTWLPATTLATNGNGWFPDIAASGRTAVVGWGAMSSTDTWSAFRRTTSRGSTWASARQLAPRTGPPSYEPTLTYQGGLWIATYTRCVLEDCVKSAIYHRDSPDGSTWGPVTRVSQGSLGQAFTGGATLAGKQIVAFTGLPEDFSSSNVYVRPSQ